MLLCCLLTLPLFAQQRDELETRRKTLIETIHRTDALLKRTKKTRATELDRFLTLKQQIAARRALIATVRTEIDAAAASETRTLAVIASLRADVVRLREEYAHLLRARYRQRRQPSQWLFLLSAAGINQAYRRYQYLRQYEERRRRQARLIGATQAVLTEKLATLAARRAEKEALLTEQEAQVQQLAVERDTRNRLLVSLGKDEQRLAAELRTQRADRKRLSGAIESLIRREMDRRRRAATRPTINPTPPSTPTAPPTTTASPPPAAGALSDDFRRRRGRLGWPVPNGVVVQGFGRQPHPTLPNIFVDNSGVDLRTPADAPVRAVFAGEVVDVTRVPGMQYTVLVRHGDYFTVYSHLVAPEVAAGETVTPRTALGRVYTDPQSNGGRLHFELWDGRRPLNPTHWLR